MFSDVLQSTAGATAFVVAAMMIFIVFFCAMIVWVFGLDRSLVNELARLPLEAEASNAEGRSDHE